MASVLIKFRCDWADEFDVKCFAAYTNTTLEEQKVRIQKRLDTGGGFYFGTNEGFEDDDLSIHDYTFTEISDEEYEFLKRNFSSYDNSVEWGTGTNAFEDNDEYDLDYDVEDNK